MRVESIVHRLCKPVVEAVHAVRVRAVVAASTAVIWAGRLSVSRIGRALRGPTSPKHSIKRIDRLLSNQRLWLERAAFFRALASLVVSEEIMPRVLVDWTKLVGDQHALVAAVPVGGRAVPIYSEVHDERRLGNPRVQARFLRQLATVLPAGCRPIIVADAGFKTPFFVAVRALDWHFVIRLRGRLSPRSPETRTTTPLHSIFGWATEVPFDLGEWQLASREKSAIFCRLILAGRPRRRRRSYGRRLNWASERKAAQGAKEPWVLATSINEATPTDVVDIYATRMQIEETFRDTKDHRFGWALLQARSSSSSRLEVLLLLAALATAAVILCGLQAERLGLHRGYQANTVRRRVLSLFALGVAVIARMDTRIPDVLPPLQPDGLSP
jgi:Transposase DDE domain